MRARVTCPMCTMFCVGLLEFDIQRSVKYSVKYSIFSLHVCGCVYHEQLRETQELVCVDWQVAHLPCPLRECGVGGILCKTCMSFFDVLVGNLSVATIIDDRCPPFMGNDHRGDHVLQRMISLRRAIVRRRRSFCAISWARPRRSIAAVLCAVCQETAIAQ